MTHPAPVRALPKTLTVRFSEAADSRRVMDFYLQHPDPAYAPRHNPGAPGIDTLTRIREQQAIIIEDETGIIHGASVCYRHGINQNSSTHRWSELGTTRITLSGCDLYPFIVASQAVYAHIQERPQDFIFADIHKKDATKKVLYLLGTKLRWPIFVPEQSLKNETQKSLDPSKRNIPVDYLKCDSAALAFQASVVLDRLKTGVLHHKPSHTDIALDLSRFSLAKTLHSNVIQLANNLHTPLPPSP